MSIFYQDLFEQSSQMLLGNVDEVREREATDELLPWGRDFSIAELKVSEFGQSLVGMLGSVDSTTQ